MKKAIILLFMVIAFACNNENPTVIISTSMGDIKVEIYNEEAPITAANFLHHVDNGSYENSIFYRVVHLKNQPNNAVKIEVIQGGLFNDSIIGQIATIEHEHTGKTGICHHDGTISMARVEPGTASTEFFICINDQPSLDYGGNRNPDGQGFAAFGQVIEGMEVVQSIQQLHEEDQSLLDPVIIKSINRVK